MKKLNAVLNTVIGAFVGVFIGNSLYVYRRFKTYPELYAMQSAPWYTSIAVNGLLTLFVLLVCVVIKAIVNNKLKKSDRK